MTVLSRLLVDRRRSLVWWSAGMAATVLFTVAFFPSIRDQVAFDEVIQSLPEPMQALIGTQAGVRLTSAPGYLNSRLFSTLLPLLLLVFGIGLGARAIGGTEDEGTLELLMSNPVTRTQVFVQRYAALVTLLAALAAVSILSVVALAPPFRALEDVSLRLLAEATLGVFFLALGYGTLSFAVGAAWGRRAPAIAVATSVAVAGYLAQGVIALTPAAGWLRFFTPWHWYLDRPALVFGLSMPAVWAPLVLSAVLLVAGWWRFGARDLR